jgi:Dolichyl-phosphate-mannose-protein mannosyltransferase
MGGTFWKLDGNIRSRLEGPPWRLLILSLMIIAGVCLRLYGIDQPPMDFHEVRQYHGALLARGLYEWLLTGDLKTMPPDGIIEPPTLEFLASLSYLILGGEHLWIPRLLSVLFWMVGGVFLYLIAKKISSPNAAIFSVAFYLFVPYSVFASRAFMPDPLMVMLLVIAIFTILRYHEQPSTRRLVIAAVASSLVTFAKPGICFFQVFGAFVSLAVYRQGVRKALISPHFLTFAVLSIVPTGLYVVYGKFVSGFLDPPGRRVVPQLLLQASFWQDWLSIVSVVVSLTALLGGLVGALLLLRGLPRALLAGLWGGYLIFGLVFTHHIHTHDYYSLQLVPVVALSLAPVAAAAIQRLGQTGLRNPAAVFIVALSVSALVLAAAEQRQTISEIAGQERTASEYAHWVETYEEIGQVANHSHRTLIFFSGEYAFDYGWPLMYHGRLAGENWPYPWEVEGNQRAGPELINTLYPKRPPEYFILSKNWWAKKYKGRFEDYRDLKRFLKGFPRTRGGQYIVFDLRK